MAKFCDIIDLQLVIGAKMSLWVKQMCRCNCRKDILIDIIYPAYRFAFLLSVYANMLIFVLMLPPSPQILYLSHTHTLSSLSLSFSHIKTHGNLFHLSLITIKSADNYSCFTQRAEHNNISTTKMNINKKIWTVEICQNYEKIIF